MLKILSDKDCDHFYNTSDTDLYVKPEVYCVGEIKNVSIYIFLIVPVVPNFKWRIGVWMEKDGKFKKVKEDARKHIKDKHYGAMYYKDTDLGKRLSYIVSPGVCNGDYGGPLFYRTKYRGYTYKIVTGLTL